MSDDELSTSLRLLNGRKESYEKGSFLHLPWTRLERFGLVLSGNVQACCDDYDGNRSIMAETQPGMTFGESLCWLGAEHSPVYIYAPEKAEVLWLSLSRLFETNTGETAVWDMQKRFISLLASRTLSMNDRIQVLSKTTIREKLIMYFSQLASSSGKTSFQIPLNREDMAAYVGTDRAALSRELSHMKMDGLIDYHKNHFVLKKTRYFEK